MIFSTPLLGPGVLGCLLGVLAGNLASQQPAGLTRAKREGRAKWNPQAGCCTTRQETGLSCACMYRGGGSYAAPAVLTSMRCSPARGDRPRLDAVCEARLETPALFLHGSPSQPGAKREKEEEKRKRSGRVWPVLAPTAAAAAESQRTTTSHTTPCSHPHSSSTVEYPQVQSRRELPAQLAEYDGARMTVVEVSRPDAWALLGDSSRSVCQCNICTVVI